MLNIDPTTPSERKLAETREGWLTVAAERMWPSVTSNGGKRPEKCRVSCGWPSKSALMRASSKSRRIGEAWHAGSADGAREIFISPALVKPVDVLGTLLHEMVHAALPGEVGHGAPFARICKVVGFEGKPTQNYPGESLTEMMEELAKTIGHYPHAALDATPKAKQKARLMLVSCPSCGCKVRMTRVWIDTYMPTCGCGTGMVSEEYEVAGEPLNLEASSVSYVTEDGRFRLSTTKTGRVEARWLVAELEDEDGEVSTRWCYRANRADALAFIEAVRAGETGFPEVELEEELEAEDETFDELDDLDLGDLDELELAPGEGDEYLADDEDETPDYEDGRIAEDEEADYVKLTDYREAAGERTSRKIGSGLEGALD